MRDVVLARPVVVELPENGLGLLLTDPEPDE
jgi:hypothetical protein